MTKLFVGGIPYSLINQQLQDLFTKFGTVTSAKIVIDIYSGNSKGFAFVEMPNDSEAQTAIKELDGFGLEGRKIGVSVARPREDHQNHNRRGNNSFSRGSHRR